MKSLQTMIAALSIAGFGAAALLNGTAYAEIGTAKSYANAHHRWAARHYRSVAADQPYRRIDAEGWRYRNGNWDNDCFRHLDYLSGMDACSR
jgi:hypothetical protein